MRDKKPNLKQEILENATRFEFFEAVRILKLLEKSSAQAVEKSKPVQPTGASEKSETKNGALDVRFRSAATKNFPAGEIHKLEHRDNVIELFTNVIGLFGPTGVLPHQDKDLISGGEPNLLLRDFLDIFNTRIISLFFEAWKANRPDILLEMFQRKISKREDSSTLMLLSICGRALSQTRNQHLFPDDVFAASAGLLSRNVRSSSAIRRCIASQFNVPVVVQEFIGERLYLPRRIQTRVSAQGTAYNVLGKTAIVGQSVIAHRQRFEVRLGPLSRHEFESLCPYENRDSEKKNVTNNIAFRRLVDLIKSMQGRPLDFDVRFQVKPEAVSGTQLGSTRLGFDSWVISKPTTKIRADTVKRFTWDVSS